MKHSKYGLIWLLFSILYRQLSALPEGRILTEVETQIWTFELGDCHLHNPEQLLDWASKLEGNEHTDTGQDNTVEEAKKIPDQDNASTPVQDNASTKIQENTSTKIQDNTSTKIHDNISPPDQVNNDDTPLDTVNKEADKVGSKDTEEDIIVDPKVKDDGKDSRQTDRQRKLDLKLLSIRQSPKKAISSPTQQTHKISIIKQIIRDRKIPPSSQALSQIEDTPDMDVHLKLTHQSRRARVLEETDPRLEVESPEIKIMEVDPKSGKYEDMGDYGLRELKYFDLVTRDLEDVDTEMEIGFQIGDYFWDKGRIDLESETIVKSYLTWNLFRGTNVKGTENVYNLYDKTGPEKSLVMQIQCFNSLVGVEMFDIKQSANKNWAGLGASLLRVVGLLILWI